MASAARAGREYALGLGLGAVGAGLLLLSVRQGWARVIIPGTPPIPGTDLTVRGQDLVPLAGALGLVSLAGLAAVVATRGFGRRLVGVLLALSGAVTAVLVGEAVSTPAVIAAAAHGTAAQQAGSVTGGSVPGAPAGLGGTSSLSAAGHVIMVSFPWRGLAVLGALVVLAAGVLVTWRGTRWPVMSSRYDQPGGARPPSGTDPATLWESLSKGLDPTEPGGPHRGQLGS